MPVEHSDLNKGGFTLVEMATIIIIVGFIMAAFCSLYNVYSKRQQSQGTWDNLDAIRQAIGEYQFQTGHYPCPAGLALGPGESFYGDAICPAVAPAAGALASGSCSSQGICRYDSSMNRQYVTPGKTDTILVGAVPINELLKVNKLTKLSSSQTVDSWNNKIVYIVTESQTNASFNSNHGVIEIIDEHNQDVLTPADSAHFALISYGRNGAGAYSLNGKQSTACDLTSIESQNCNIHSSKFLSALLSSQPGLTYSDDYLMFGLASATNLWVSSFASPGSAYNTNAFNVGLGTKFPGNTYDVAGTLGNPSPDDDADNNNIKALSNQLCDSAGNNCYDLNIIANDALVVPSNPGKPECPVGQVLNGIGTRSVAAPGYPAHPNTVTAECISLAPVSYDGKCASGEYLNAISSKQGMRCCTNGTTTCHWTNP